MEQFLNLPTPVKAVLAALTGTSIVGAVAIIDPKLAGIVAIGLVLLVAAIAAFIGMRAALRRRSAGILGRDLTQHSAGAPAGVNDANKRAKLDDVRRVFAEGLAKFGSVERIYKYPWYMIVGEPGSGKTQAIIHSNVGFPPGLQDELQGVGGTINMNWWFTNQAIFLDTAGRLMFEEVKPGETNEWKEFLQLLVRNRPNCPINGLLLIIPTDALINDKDEDYTDSKGQRRLGLNTKAGKIARQFELIQRTLDIRFPVFVVITKCDMMSGFREFFDDFADAASVNQMLGWSNPADRDAIFEPERVTDHLATVVQRIKKRRLSLLRDPIPQKGEERRTDEVDALYSLPQSIQLLAPRLRQYLEKIFVAGDWSPKPLFLRGIYFTSSMREGAALDQELAQALGLSADQLSEAKVWEKERAYFLRDIFAEKVFREKGLVTKASDTKKMLRRRGLLLWGTASVLALMFVGFTFYAYEQFADSIKRHSDLWATAKNRDDWKEGRWNALVTPDKSGDTVMRFHGSEPPITVGGRRLPLLTYHDQLRDVATKEIETGWVYRPILKWANLNQDRLKAQRIVYEASVVYPLVQSARFRMQKEAIADAIDASESGDSRLEREAYALRALLRIESDKVSTGRKVEDVPKDVLVPLLQYVTASKAPADAEKLKNDEKLKMFGSGFTSTYTTNPTATWVPERLAIGSTSLAQNAPIDAGLRRFRALAGETVQTQLETAAKIGKMRDDLREFRKIEIEMEATASGPGKTKEEEKLVALLAQLATVKLRFDEKYKATLKGGLFPNGKISLVEAYNKVVTESQNRSEATVKLLQDAVKPHLDLKDHLGHPTAKLFNDVNDELEKTKTNLGEQVQQVFSKTEQEELKELDTYLYDFGDRRRIYEVRSATYQEAAGVAAITDKFDDLIGKGWEPLTKLLTEIDAIRSQLPKIQQKMTKDSLSIVEACNTLLDVAKERRRAPISTAYLAQTRAKLEAVFFEPFVSEAGRKLKPMTKDERTAAYLLIDKWKLDLASPDFQKIEPAAKTKLTLFSPDLDAMKNAGSAYDQFIKQLQKLKVKIHLMGPGDYKWHIVEGGGKKVNIFKGGTFTIIVDYDGKTVPIRFYDPVNGRSTSGSIDTRRPGEQEAGGLSFSVQLLGDKGEPASFPTEPLPGPKKSSVIAKLL